MPSLKTFFRSCFIQEITPHAIDHAIEELLNALMKEQECQLDLDQIVITPSSRGMSQNMAIVTISAYREL